MLYFLISWSFITEIGFLNFHEKSMYNAKHQPLASKFIVHITKAKTQYSSLTIDFFFLGRMYI